MALSLQLEELSHILVHTNDLEVEGIGQREIANGVAEGRLVRVRRGWYVSSERWEPLNAEARHRVMVIAAHRAAVIAPLFSHCSAAAIHELPLFRPRLGRVHTIVQDRGSRSTARMSRHLGSVSRDETVQISGLQVTDLIRTAIDVARTESFESAVICCDAAMRSLASNKPVADGRLRELMLMRLRELAPVRGSARAARAIAFASQLSESPLESLSRLQLARLGIEAVCQVPVKGPSGQSYRIDFELIGQEVFCEVDGLAKYTDAELLNDRSLQSTLLAEKQREDWIRGLTGKRVIRWGWKDARDLSSLERRLRQFGVTVPARDRKRLLTLT